jgi:hypothetical protein
MHVHAFHGERCAGPQGHRFQKPVRQPAPFTTYGAEAMNTIHLPIEAPRADWPGLIERAATALEAADSYTLALELRAIAVALRGGAA